MSSVERNAYREEMQYYVYYLKKHDWGNLLEKIR